MPAPYKLSIEEASDMIYKKKLTPIQLLESHLDRIEKLESFIEAWVTVNKEKAISDAIKLTKEAENEKIRSRLHGIPIGFKDIIYTAGIKTTMGSKIYDNYLPEHDAIVVETLKRHGAINLGKTKTVEFAVSDPTITRNPWNLEHTPGGSSSGSAAAVSAGMCLSALGSQTGGSTIRPGAYCGIVAMKPTYDIISRKGVYPVSWSLDHVGIFTRSVQDMNIVLNSLIKDDSKLTSQGIDLEKVPRIALLKEYFHENADIEIQNNMQETVNKLRDAGAEILEVPLPKKFHVIHAAHGIIFSAETASIHEDLFNTRAHDYGPGITNTIATGLFMPATTYLKALRIRGRIILDMINKMKDFDCFLTPSTTTPAPRGLESTGSPAFNSPWSFCGFPAISIPSGLTKEKLPIGIQLISRPFSDFHLLRISQWCEAILDFNKDPHEPILTINPTLE